MAYKDKEKQKAANKAAAKRYREKGMTQETENAIPVIPELPNVIP